MLSATPLLRLGTLLCLVLFSHYSADADSNLLVNGDVEKDTDEKQPLKWTSKVVEDERLDDTEATFHYAKDPDPKRRHVLHTKVTAGAERAIWSQSITDVVQRIKRGKKYEVSLWIKYELLNEPAKDAQPVTARWNVWGSDSENVIAPVLTPGGNFEMMTPFTGMKQVDKKSGWKQYKVVVQIPTEPYAPAMSWFYVGLAAPGELWADDFRVVEVPDSTPVGPMLK